jgi:hypothetical protein
VCARARAYPVGIVVGEESLGREAIQFKLGLGEFTLVHPRCGRPRIRPLTPTHPTHGPLGRVALGVGETGRRGSKPAAARFARRCRNLLPDHGADALTPVVGMVVVLLAVRVRLVAVVMVMVVVVLMVVLCENNDRV